MHISKFHKIIQHFFETHLQNIWFAVSAVVASYLLTDIQGANHLNIAAGKL